MTSPVAQGLISTWIWRHCPLFLAPSPSNKAIVVVQFFSSYSPCTAHIPNHGRSFPMGHAPSKEVACLTWALWSPPTWWGRGGRLNQEHGLPMPSALPPQSPGHSWRLVTQETVGRSGVWARPPHLIVNIIPRNLSILEFHGSHLAIWWLIH